MRSPAFWSFFDGEAAPKLSHRAETFRKAFEYLDGFDRPVGIVETGCMRQKDNWQGDGQSTLLFDRYVGEQPGSIVYAVDRDPVVIALCKSLVSDSVSLHTADSIRFLAVLAQARPSDLPSVDLLYLDSVDVNMLAPLPSAAHHLKELLAAVPLLSPQTLVMVDDSPSSLFGYVDGQKYVPLGVPRVGGKGLLIAEYAQAVGVAPAFAAYQCGWVGLGR